MSALFGSPLIATELLGAGVESLARVRDSIIICDGEREAAADFASTIQSGVLDSMVEELDDDAIERSIAEINEAIRRSALRRS